MTGLPALLLAALAALPALPAPAGADGAESLGFELCTGLARRADALASAPESAPTAGTKAALTGLLGDAGMLGAAQVRGVRLTPAWTDRAGKRLAATEDPAEIRKLAEFAANRLSATCHHLATAGEASASADRAALVAILSRPEYELRDRDEVFLFRLLERIRTWLREVLDTNQGVMSVALSFRTVFLAGACLLAAWLALRLARTSLRRRRRLLEDEAEGPIVLDDPARYEAQASRALSAGEGREAVRLGLLTLLATLERLRLAAPGRAATNREVAEQIPGRGGSPVLEQQTRALVDWYDRAWYGLAPVSAGEARGFLDHVQAARAKADADARVRREAA